MGAMLGLAHDPGYRLLGKLVFSVEDDVPGQASTWIDAQLAELHLRPEEQSRIALAISQQLDHLLEAAKPQAIASLTIRLYSGGDGRKAEQGWGFFIVNRPLRAARGILEIYLYHGA